MFFNLASAWGRTSNKYPNFGNADRCLQFYMDTSLQYLDFIISHTGKTSQYLDKKSLNSTQFFCIGLLERLTSSSLALKTLLHQINANPSLEFACGIILRSALLDTLIVLNLYNILIDNEASNKTEAEKEQIVKEFCDTMLSDGLENTLKYIKAAKDVNIITQQQLTDTFKNFTASHQIFFEQYANDGSIPVLKNKKYYSPTELFKKLANSPNLKELSKIYDSYLFFSKYDHFGILYYEVSRQKYLDQLERICKGIELFVGTQSILHLALRMYSGNDNFLNEQSNIAAQYLSDKILFPVPQTQQQNSGGTIY